MNPSFQFTLYNNRIGPNGWKVVIVLEELGKLTYDTVYLNLGSGEHKSPKFLQFNPNGRVPALIDHGSDEFVIWESDAILIYLVDEYDKEHKISVAETNDKYHQLQWLRRARGWFIPWAPEPVSSAVERYRKEILRVWGVLDGVVAEREWLVGGKCTIADLSFIPWNVAALTLLMKGYKGFSEETLQKDFSAVSRWYTALISREAVLKAYAIKNFQMEVTPPQACTK
ncbi:thioredoxin-like protein [Cerioporus squamosus]|nr:thioredoxin-like protein [Cerioporus squamosus]